MNETESLPFETSESSDRAGMYQFLVRLWAREIEGDLLTELQSGTLASPFRDAGGLVPLCEDNTELLDELQSDYCRLFIGPRGHFPPVQSVIEEGRFEGEAASSIRGFNSLLDQGGMHWELLPDDHIANIFTTYCRFLVAENVPSESQSDFDDLVASFFSAHILWVIEFARFVAQYAKTDFYSSLMSLTERFLHQEAALMETGQPVNRM